MALATIGTNQRLAELTEAFFKKDQQDKAATTGLNKENIYGTDGQKPAWNEALQQYVMPSARVQESAH